jgi:hypothetical protein
MMVPSADWDFPWGFCGDFNGEFTNQNGDWEIASW